jgi:hypothetical protein
VCDTQERHCIWAGPRPDDDGDHGNTCLPCWVARRNVPNTPGATTGRGPGFIATPSASINARLIRLVPDEGKELIEFTRAQDNSLGVDLKVVNWGSKGTDSSKYARAVPGDIVQTFRNFVDSM